MDNNTVDSKGTTRTEAKEMLENLYRRGFFENMDELALALGRNTGELENIFSGREMMDDDLAMKVRALAEERSIKIEKAEHKS